MGVYIDEYILVKYNYLQISYQNKHYCWLFMAENGPPLT